MDDKNTIIDETIKKMKDDIKSIFENVEFYQNDCNKVIKKLKNK